MSYNNFKPTIWETAIEQELKRIHVFAADTNQKYKGEVSKMGDSVRILGVGKPTITEDVGDADIELSAPEKVEDTSALLKINHRARFNYRVDDIDKAQSSGDIEAALKTESSEGLADKMDLAISNLAKDPLAVLYTKTATVLTADNVLDLLDGCIQKLQENDVSLSTMVTATLPPWVYTLFKKAYIKLDTDNSDMMKNGQVAKYGNAIIRMSNNIAKNSSGDSLVQVKTQRAIGFANPVTHVEAYRPESGFTDALKGFVLYGAKIVRPKEMVVLNCKQA